MMHMIRDLYLTVFDPQPHAIAAKADRLAQRAIESSDKVVAESRKLTRHGDPFATMVRGMRGESRPRSRRTKKT